MDHVDSKFDIHLKVNRIYEEKLGKEKKRYKDRMGTNSLTGYFYIHLAYITLILHCFAKISE